VKEPTVRDGGDAEPILELTGVDVVPPGAHRPVLLGATLTLRRGQIGALLGGNGAGKSTLLRAAAGLWPAARGTIRSPAREGPDPRSCALLLEDPASQFVTSTAAEEIAFTLENAELPREEIARRVGDALREFDLEAFSGRDPLTMSPGEQERLLLAAALALRPALLLLDDPFLYLGPGEGRVIWERLREAVDGGRVEAILLASHDGEIAAEADVAGVLDQGHLLAWGPPTEALGMALPASIEPPLGLRLERRLRELGWTVAGEGYSVEEMARRLTPEVRP
jgi:energy-coupling factor transporter ATP-binding protein EcfA2